MKQIYEKVYIKLTTGLLNEALGSVRWLLILYFGLSYLDKRRNKKNNEKIFLNIHKETFADQFNKSYNYTKFV